MYKEENDFDTKFFKSILLKGTVDEFERSWVSLLEKYDLNDNGWLSKCTISKKNGCQYTLRSTFFTNMQTTQHSESINSFFDG